MTTFLPNHWNAIRAFYREADKDIQRAGRNEWGMDPYLWDGEGIIFFTPIENWLWHDIRMCDAVLYPQYPVGRFFVDFGNPVAKVAIECDGAEYHADQAKDAARDRELESLGWTVYRFPGWMCKGDSDEETGAPSEAYTRMKAICDKHGISRFSRLKSDEWEPIGSMVEQVVECMYRHAEIVQATRAARRSM